MRDLPGTGETKLGPRLLAAAGNPALQTWQRDVMNQVATLGTADGDGNLSMITSLTPLSYPAAVFDATRRELVVFGQTSGSYDYLNAPWGLSLDNPTWTRLCDGTPGGLAYGSSAVVDALRDRIVLFGGFGSSGITNAVWTYSRATTPYWTQLLPGGTPPPSRTGHTAIYDPGGDRMIVFGGQGSGVSNGVWVLSFGGTPTWSQMAVTGSPPSSRRDHTAIYDSVHQRMIVFGGYDSNGRLNDTWALSLGPNPTWAELSPTGTWPTPRLGHSAVYDASRDEMIVFGGNDASSLADTWSLSLGGSPAWSPVSVSGQLPPGRYSHVAILDTAQDRMVIFGGANMTDTWTLSLGATHVWTELSAAGIGPVAKAWPSLVYDPSFHRMIVFGGLSTFNTSSNETWSLALSDPPAWSRLSPSGTPPQARIENSAIDDPVNHRMIVYGGYPSPYNATPFSDLWALSLDGGLAWTQLSPSGTPPTARARHAAIYDPVRERMIVFGGYDGTVSLNDTWTLTLDGTPTWSELTTANHPPITSFPRAVYDPLRDRMIVLVGSALWSLSLSGTPDWSQLILSGTPPPDVGNYSVTFDPVRDRLILCHLGYCEFWSASLGASAAWIELNPAYDQCLVDCPLSGTNSIYDNAYDQMVFFGGIYGKSVQRYTWSLFWGTPQNLPPPTMLTATAIPCGNDVSLEWTDNASDETGFEVQSKWSDDPSTAYATVATLAANTTQYLVSQTDGISHAYRVRAVRGQTPSSFSNEVSIRAEGSAIPQPPQEMYAKSLGDNQTLRVHLYPPGGTADWNGVSHMEVRQYRADDLTTAIATIVATPGAAREQTVDFVGTPGTDYTFRAWNKNDCGQSGGYASTSIPVTPRMAPVVLVHGISSTSAVWGSVWTSRLQNPPYGTGRYFAVNFKNSVDFWSLWAVELQTQIETLLQNAWPQDELVDLVAHSQGGLASRLYIESFPLGKRRVRTLVMLGTPNHGGRFATAGSLLSGLNRGLASAAVYDLQTNSESLRRLNFGNTYTEDDICADTPLEVEEQRRGSVEYYTLAGTGPTALTCSIGQGWLRCRLNAARDPGSCDGDGVVPWKSAGLRALDASHQWLDTDVCNLDVGLAHNEDLAWPPASESMLASGPVVDHVINILTGSPCRDPGFATYGAGALETAEAADSTYLLVASILDSLDAGSGRSHPAWVDSCGSVSVFVSWAGDPVSIQLLGPDSTIFLPADTTVVPALRYETDATLQYAAFAVENPAIGTWSVHVESGSTPATYYSVDWVTDSSGYRLDASAAPEILVPGDVVSLTATLRYEGVPVPCTMEARILIPSGTEFTVPLVDDGTGSDSTALDLTYSGSFLAPDENGVCRVAFSSTTPSEGGEVSRVADGLFWVVHRPDLSVMAEDIRLDPPVGAVNEPVDLFATVHNVGNAPSDSVSVEVLDGSSNTSLGQVRVAVLPGDSVEVQIECAFSSYGEHSISVVVNPPEGGDLDPTNNEAQVAFSVAGEVPTTGVGESASPPLQPRLALPRPNPARDRVVIGFDLIQSGRVVVQVFDIGGRLVQELTDEFLPAGTYVREWNGRDGFGSQVGSGIYFLKVVAPGLHKSRKVVLLR